MIRNLIIPLGICLTCVGSFAALSGTPVATPAGFAEHTIATSLTGGYQVVVSDVNHDGKPDLIALASGMSELVWFENPDWKRHVLVQNVPGPINCAAADIDGDGIPEIALAYGFATDPSKSAGIVSILKHEGEVTRPWRMTEIDRLPTAHRLRWADIDGDGKKALVNAPLAGAAAKPPDYRGSVPLVVYRPPSWKRETISEDLQGVLHGILISDWNQDSREDVLTASFLGIDVFSLDKNKRWQRTRISTGNSDPWPRSGSSEVARGRLGRDTFLGSIEPWHGNQVVVYRREKGTWTRNVIDTTLNDGHVLLTADLNSDGTDEIIAGYRGPGRSVYIYSADDSKGSHWSRQVVDNGGISAAGCAVADLNRDGRLDIACIGMATANLKWYENLGPAGVKK